MKQPRGAALADHYHRYAIPQPKAGTHRAVAVVRELATGKTHERGADFLVM